MLTKRFVDNVLVQADYMSGDRNTIASALRVDQRLGILVLGKKNFPAEANDLVKLYRSAGGANRVELRLYEAPRPPVTRPPTPVPPPSADTETALVRAAYKEVDNWVHNGLDKRENPAPAWTKENVGGGVRLNSATYGTRVISDAFGTNADEAKTKLQAHWRLPPNGPGNGAVRTAMQNYLINKGFNRNRSYVFLFVKEGERTAEKAHHFTSILTWRLLMERVQMETNIIPVAVGDRVGLTTLPSLVQFWKDPEFQGIVNRSRLDARTAQLGMWCMLAEFFNGISMIGMRSGILEVPALLGIRTLYLEEKHNEQAARMEKWIGKVPTFERQVVNTPPGIKQQIYWNEQSLKTPRTSDVNQHARASGSHVRNMVMGFESVGKSKSPLSQDQIVDVVFGRRSLGQFVPAQKFMLETSEFDAIITWIKRTPTKTGASDRHGSIPGHVEVRDIALNEQSSETAITNWSKYFASPEYLKSLPVIKDS